FFQAEDGIRDFHVTGVQTCALPILLWRPTDNLDITLTGDWNKQDAVCCGSVFVAVGETQRPINRQYAALAAAQGYVVPSTNPYRSEERRVGKECGSRWAAIALTKYD